MVYGRLGIRVLEPINRPKQTFFRFLFYPLARRTNAHAQTGRGAAITLNHARRRSRAVRHAHRPAEYDGRAGVGQRRGDLWGANDKRSFWTAAVAAAVVVVMVVVAAAAARFASADASKRRTTTTTTSHRHYAIIPHITQCARLFFYFGFIYHPFFSKRSLCVLRHYDFYHYRSPSEYRDTLARV